MPKLSALVLPLCGVLTFVLLLTGCGGGGRIPVSGTLLAADGTPVVKARITARCNETGAWGTAVTDASGSFRLKGDDSVDGVPPGKYYLTIVEDRGDWDHPQPPMIHQKYETPAISKLELDVTTEKKIEFELKLDPPD